MLIKKLCALGLIMNIALHGAAAGAGAGAGAGAAADKSCAFSIAKDRFQWGDSLTTQLLNNSAQLLDLFNKSASLRALRKQHDAIRGQCIHWDPINPDSDCGGGYIAALTPAQEMEKAKLAQQLSKLTEEEAYLEGQRVQLGLLLKSKLPSNMPAHLGHLDGPFADGTTTAEIRLSKTDKGARLTIKSLTGSTETTETIDILESGRAQSPQRGGM